MSKKYSPSPQNDKAGETVIAVEVKTADDFLAESAQKTFAGPESVSTDISHSDNFPAIEEEGVPTKVERAAKLRQQLKELDQKRGGIEKELMELNADIYADSQKITERDRIAGLRRSSELLRQAGRIPQNQINTGRLRQWMGTKGNRG